MLTARKNFASDVRMTKKAAKLSEITRAISYLNVAVTHVATPAAAVYIIRSGFPMNSYGISYKGGISLYVSFQEHRRKSAQCAATMTC